MRSCGFFHFFSDYIAKKTYARIPTTRHPDHEYIVARHDRYIEAYNSRSVERMVEFMDEEDFVYSDFGGQREEMSHSTVKNQFEHTFSNFHDLEIRTVSLHGYKRFTAWEWEITTKPALGGDGQRLAAEEATPMKLIGCTLMWWNDKDKIVKNHDYTHARDP